MASAMTGWAARTLSAIFLVRVAPQWLVPPVSFLIEFLAAIPSIAYGIWALFVLAPFLQSHVEPGLNSLLGYVPGFGWLFQQSIETGQRSMIRPIPLTGRDMFSGGLILVGAVAMTPSIPIPPPGHPPQIIAILIG